MMYNHSKAEGWPLCFTVEGDIDLMNTEDGQYILVIEPHTVDYLGWSNAKIRLTLTPEQVSALTRLEL